MDSDNKAMRASSPNVSNLLQQIFVRAIAIIISKPQEFPELQGAVLALVFGIWLLLPGRENGSIADKLLDKAVPYHVIAVVFVSMGLIQIYGVTVGTYKLRRFLAITVAMLWLFCGLVIAIQNWLLMPVPLLFCFSFGAAWAFWQMRH